MAEHEDKRSLQTNLLGAEVQFLPPSGGHDTGRIRVVYLTSNGSPMFLVQDDGGALIRVSPDSARVRCG